MLRALGARRWETVRAPFAHESGMDYTLLWRGEPEDGAPTGRRGIRRLSGSVRRREALSERGDL
jgi:hypothetical protein